MIRLYYFLILATLFHTDVFCQSATNERLTKILNETKNIKAFGESDANDLAFRITNNYSSEAEKASAIACWIIQHIKYDDMGYDDGENVKIDIENILKKRKAHHYGYALLFNEMCRHIGLRAEAVPGYTRPDDFFSGDTLFRHNHTWSVVNFDDSWHIIDLTYASTTKEQKKQRMERMMYKSFNNPYTIKYQYKKDIKPEWIYKYPTQMIRTHFPSDHYMQMLREPITLETFCKGEDSIITYLEKNRIGAVQSNYITNYSVKPLNKKYEYLRKVSIKNNPKNDRDFGFYTYKIAEDMVNNAPLHNEGQHLMDSAEYAQFLNLRETAKNYLDNSIDDNGDEFVMYSDRNNNWKFFIKSENKTLKFQIKRIKTRYNKQLKKTVKNRSKLNKIRNFVIIRQKTKNRNLIKNVKRPEKNTAANNRGAYLLMKKWEVQDSTVKAAIADLDSLISANSIEKQKELIRNEQTSSHIIKANNEFMEKRYPSDLHRPLTYSVLEPEKTLFINNLNTIDSLNNSIADSLLNDQLRKLTDIYTDIKTLNKLFTEEQKFVLKIKKMSYDDNSEDSIYYENKASFDESLAFYKKAITSYLLPHKDYKKIYKKNIKGLNTSTLLLTKDDAGEKKRHRRYRDFRKGLKITEDRRAKAIKEDTKLLKDYVILSAEEDFTGEE